jgi:manganese transport protein
MQLSFAVVPWFYYGSKDKMGAFVNRNWMKVTSWIIATIIIGLNLYLLYDTFF